MARVVVSEFMNEEALAPLRESYEVLFDPTLVDDRPRLLTELAGAAAIIVRNRTQVDVDLLDAAPGLRAVGRLGVGLDNIDMDACAARGVVVHPATGANALAVAEYVVAAVLVLFRGAYQANASMLSGSWPRAELQGRETSGKTLALVGLGGIARLVAERAVALGMRVRAYDPFLDVEDDAWSRVQRVDAIDDLLRGADAVSVHVPLNDETRHVLDAARLDLLAPNAVVVNTARGGIVDDAALAEALRSGRLGGAALDVFEVEPLTADAAEIFAGLDNVVLTPHIAGLTAESNSRVSDITVANVLKTLSDK
ncbi:MAG: hydroxyacid dehydrogenase [Acidimicrobiia bacterium]|nr:hydroxyacid dehydrogenase [Acidimicrobiia bacterium]